MVSTGISKSRALRKWLFIIIALAYLAAFIYLYQNDPFPEGVGDLVSGAMTSLAALVAALISSMVWRHYGKGTPPRRTWMHFTLALWGWAIAEWVWLYEYWIDGAYILGPADYFWVASYFFFLAALYGQYYLIYRPKPQVGAGYLVLSILAVLAFSYLYANWLSGSSGQTITSEILVNAFYGVGDVALVIGALWLVIAFRQGALGRPWIGLVVFGFSDLLYSWLETSGLYAWSLAEGNPLTTITDVTYLAAYLVIAFGCYMQWLLLSYGPRFKYDSQ